MFCKSLILRDFSLSIEKSATSLNCEQIMPEGEQAALSRFSEAEYHTRLLLEGQKDSYTV